MRSLTVPPLLALLLAGCGHSSSPPSTPAAPPAESPAADADASGLAGLWYVYMRDMPWMALRVQVLAAPGGPSVSWISFDWSGSTDVDHLASASKPVSVQLKGQLPTLSLDGPAPMLTADGTPNGQQGNWRLEVHAPPDGPRRLVGTAVSEELTNPGGTPVEMSHEWRAWKRP